MKKSKILVSCTAIIALLLSLCACGKSAESETTAPATENTIQTSELNITTLKGPTGLGMLKMMKDGSTDNVKFNFTIAASPEEVTAAVLKNEPDIAAVPVNLASVLYNKTNGKYITAAINTLGVLYIVDTTGEIKSVADLKGKTVYASGKGSTPEYILDYVLTKNGINPSEDVEIIYSAEHSETVALLSRGKAKIALLPEPNVTTVLMNSEINAKAAIDMTEEWSKVSEDGSAPVQGCIIVKKDLLDSNPAAFDSFMTAYRESVNYVNNTVTEASALAETFGIIPKAAVAEKSIPNCNLVFIDGAEMKNTLSAFLKILFDYDSKSIGGSLPDEGMYYIK